MRQTKIYEMSFASVYPHYVAKAEKKGRSQAEVDEIIYWLTGYSPEQFTGQLENKSTMRDFFDDAPQLNENRFLITGMICGYRIEEMEDSLMREIRYLDKMIDELAKGRKMAKILRQQ